MTYLIMSGLLLLLMVLIANRNPSSVRQELANRKRVASKQYYLGSPSLRIALRYKLGLLEGLDTIILVWGARIATPLLLVSYGSSLIEDRLSDLGETWSIAMQLSLMIAGCVSAYFVMPVPVRDNHQIRTIVLTVFSMGLAIAIGLWNVMGVTIHFAKVRSVEAVPVQLENHRAIAPLADIY